MVVSVDKGFNANDAINFANFQGWVRLSLYPLTRSGVIPGDKITFKDEGDNKFSVSFPFGGRERTVVIYYNKDAGRFFPPELESGFDVLMTRWIKSGFSVNEEIMGQWLQYMIKPGFVITTASDKGYLSGEYRDLRVPPEFWAPFSLVGRPEFEACAPRIIFFLRGKN